MHLFERRISDRMRIDLYEVVTLVNTRAYVSIVTAMDSLVMPKCDLVIRSLSRHSVTNDLRMNNRSNRSEACWGRLEIVPTTTYQRYNLSIAMFRLLLLKPIFFTISKFKFLMVPWERLCELTIPAFFIIFCHSLLKKPQRNCGKGKWFAAFLIVQLPLWESKWPHWIYLISLQYGLPSTNFFGNTQLLCQYGGINATNAVNFLMKRP